VEINVLLNEEEISFKEYTETGFKFDADEIIKNMKMVNYE